MGRQVEFYMLCEDLACFEAALRTNDGVAILAERMPTPEPRELETLGPLPLGFWGRYLVRRSDMDKLRIDHVPQQGDYVIRAAFSPVVEFSPSRLAEDKGRLSPGRMWFATRTWDGTSWFEPTKDFLKWADGLLNSIRRGKQYSLMKDPENGGRYISQRAAEWRDQGGRLGR